MTMRERQYLENVRRGEVRRNATRRSAVGRAAGARRPSLVKGRFNTFLTKYFPKNRIRRRIRRRIRSEFRKVLKRPIMGSPNGLTAHSLQTTENEER